MHVKKETLTTSVMVSDEIMDVYEKLKYEKERYARIMIHIIKHDLDQEHYSYYCEKYKKALYCFDYMQNLILDSVCKLNAKIILTNVTGDIIPIRKDGVFLVQYYETGGDEN